MDPIILTFDTPFEAAIACGDRTLELLSEARRERGVATLAVSGGSTPRLMFQSMATRSFEWNSIEIFQVDERCVPPDHAESNFKMLREALLISIAIDESHVHRIEGELPPEDAARAYAEVLGPHPIFDVIQRGMGPDAHTASLFPGDPLINDRTGVCAAMRREGLRNRVTLLRGVLENARNTLILATGAEKAEALRKVLREPFDPVQLPSQISSAGTIWYIDKAAALKL